MFAAALLACCLAFPDAPATVTNFSLPDATGKQHAAADWKGKSAIVLLFIGTECPVSNFYCPEYLRLAKDFEPKGVKFYAIHADPDVTTKDAADHAKEYRLTFPVLLDPTHAVAKQTGIKVVPEAVVLSNSGEILYRGRIDNRYNAAGVRRETPTSRDLEDALTAVVAGKRPAVAQTTGFGCPLPEPRK